MRRFIKGLLFVLTLNLLSGPGFAQDFRIVSGSSCGFWVHVHRFFIPSDIQGTNTFVSGTAALSDTGTSLTAQVTLDATGFKTGIGLRDRDVRKSLKAAQFPEIKFVLKQLTGFNSKLAALQGQTLTAEGTFTLLGHSAELEFPVTIIQQNGIWRVQGVCQQNFKNLGVVAPGIPGLLSVDDPLKLYVDLRFGE